MPKQESIATRDVFAKDAEWRGGKPRAFNFAIGDAVYYGYSPLRWTIKHLLEDGTARLAHPLAGFAAVKVADLRYYWNSGQVTAGAASVAERLVPRMEPVEWSAPAAQPRERRRLHDQPRPRAQEEQDMSDEHKGLPVPGYTPQSEANVDLGRESKEIEELVLRQIDLLEAENNRWRGTSRKPPFDPRWLAIARTQIEQGFMALNRAIFKPKRAPLQDDDSDPAPTVAPAKPTQHATTSPGPVNCNIRLQAQGEPYPRTCKLCGLNGCPFFPSYWRSKI